jgi:hypothetical protein
LGGTADAGDPGCPPVQRVRENEDDANKACGRRRRLLAGKGRAIGQVFDHPFAQAFVAAKTFDGVKGVVFARVVVTTSWGSGYGLEAIRAVGK